MKLQEMHDYVELRHTGTPQQINEASLGRIYQHYASDRSFAILTSWRHGLSTGENISFFKQLLSQVRQANLGYIRLRGHWAYCEIPGVAWRDCPPDQRIETIEPALFISGITIEFALHLGKQYQQEAIIYKGPNPNDQVLQIDIGGSVKSIGKFNPNKIAEVYATIVRGKTWKPTEEGPWQKGGRSFFFEYGPTNWMQAISEQEAKIRLQLTDKSNKFRCY